MLYQILKHIHNFFPLVDKIEEGEFTISGGTVSLPFLADNQYYLIENSLFNDYVVHRYNDPEEVLTDETFTGYIVPLAIPQPLIELSEEITAYQTKYAGSETPYTSESFGGYSYSKATNASGTPVGWESVFADKLDVWRKI